MGSLSTGGGSSAVAASEQAGCERFRYTDPPLLRPVVHPTFFDAL